MTVTLRPEHESLVVQAIESGAYKDPEEVIARALEMLRTDDEALRDEAGSISEKIERALGQFERGEYLTPEASKADMEERKAAWRAGHRGCIPSVR